MHEVCACTHYLLQIVYLKRFAALKSLALDGNPMAKAKPEAYRSFCLAFLPHLRFLDYALITPAQRTAAKDAGVTPDLLLLVEEKEMQRKRAREKQEGRTAGMRNLVEANIEVANTLLPTLFDDDQEHAKLKNLPGLPALMESLKTSFSYCCDEFRTAGLLKHNTIVVRAHCPRGLHNTTELPLQARGDSHILM
ncbi:hypothetical protein EON66_00180 [archaeon]|nr:MAG: hypothetical protein EON66_00180 [archaeon]